MRPWEEYLRSRRLQSLATLGQLPSDFTSWIVADEVTSPLLGRDPSGLVTPSVTTETRLIVRTILREIGRQHSGGFFVVCEGS